MKVVNLRDAIILNLLRDGNRSRAEIETRLGIQGTITEKSLALLKDSELIARQRTKGKDLYFLTPNGKSTIEKICKKLSLE